MRDRISKELGSHMIILSLVGKGAFGKVYECFNAQTHKTVALKVLRKYKLNNKQLALAEQETRILQKLNHPNIVKLFAIYNTASLFIIEMEFLKEKSLAHLLSKRTLNEEESSIIMRTIFVAVQYLHRSHVIHRDLKPENIIFGSKDLTSLKIADFGLSTEFELGERLVSKVGTLIYMAPELLIAKRYTETADIWSCGIILYTLICHKHPLYAPGDSYETYIGKLGSICWSFPKAVSKLGKDLFFRCVKENPIERYSASLAINHPWVTRIEGRIPITHMEEIRIHQDRLKMKIICLTALCLVSLNRQTKERTKISLRINSPKSITESTRSQGKLFGMDSPAKIIRKMSDGRFLNGYGSLNSPRKMEKITQNKAEKNKLSSRIKLSALAVKPQPKSAD